MTTQQIEDQIQHILATETDASRLSRRLFDADGLFGRLASTKAERRALTKTSLFRQAQDRLTELQRREAVAYRMGLVHANRTTDVSEHGCDHEPAQLPTAASHRKDASA